MNIGGIDVNTTRRNGPGKSYRDGLSLVEIARMFPNDEVARAWFEAAFWPTGPRCPRCGTDNVQSDVRHPTMTHRCRECPRKPFFSLKTGTIMEGSKLGYQTWAIAVYLLTTSLKSVSSMKMSRDLGVTQKTAWHLAMRLRRAFEQRHGKFLGPVEVDETFVGGKMRGGQGGVGKAIVVGAWDRATGTISATVTPDRKRVTLHRFIEDRVDELGSVYTDELKAYKKISRYHVSVNHSKYEWVSDDGVSTNGIESFWSMLKRSHKGTFHKLSAKHMQRYVDEFCGRHNLRELDTEDQMLLVVRSMRGKRLRYSDLVAG